MELCLGGGAGAGAVTAGEVAAAFCCAAACWAAAAALLDALRSTSKSAASIGRRKIV